MKKRFLLTASILALTALTGCEASIGTDNTQNTKGRLTYEQTLTISSYDVYYRPQTYNPNEYLLVAFSKTYEQPLTVDYAFNASAQTFTVWIDGGNAAQWTFVGNFVWAITSSQN